MATSAFPPLRFTTDSDTNKPKSNLATSTTTSMPPIGTGHATAQRPEGTSNELTQLALEVLQSQEQMDRGELKITEEMERVRLANQEKSENEFVRMKTRAYGRIYHPQSGDTTTPARGTSGIERRDMELSPESRPIFDNGRELRRDELQDAFTQPSHPPILPTYIITTKMAPEEQWTVLWTLQKDETVFRSAVTNEEQREWDRMSEDFGTLQLQLAAQAIQRGWRVKAAKKEVQQRRSLGDGLAAPGEPPPPSVTYLTPKPPTVPNSSGARPVPTISEAAMAEGWKNLSGGGANAKPADNLGAQAGAAGAAFSATDLERITRIKGIIAMFSIQQNAQLFAFVRSVFPAALELDAENVATIHLYGLASHELEEFERYVSALIHHAVPAPPSVTRTGMSVQSQSFTRRTLPPAPADPISIQKREILARRIADLIPENQKAVVLHLQNLCPQAIKADGVLDTAELDEYVYDRTNVLVLELLQQQRDQSVDIREVLEVERLRIAKEREEAERAREAEEARLAKDRMEKLDAAWVEEQRARDYQERILLLKLRKNEEMERQKRRIEQELREHEARLRWQEQEHAKWEEQKRIDRDERLRVQREKWDEMQRQWMDRQRRLDIEERERRQHLRLMSDQQQQSALESSSNLLTSGVNAPINKSGASSSSATNYDKYDRKVLLEEVNKLAPPQSRKFLAYAAYVDPQCVQHNALVPERVLTVALPFLIRYARQLRLEAEADPTGAGGAPGEGNVIPATASGVAERREPTNSNVAGAPSTMSERRGTPPEMKHLSASTVAAADSQSRKSLATNNPDLLSSAATQGSLVGEGPGARSTSTSTFNMAPNAPPKDVSVEEQMKLAEAIRRLSAAAQSELCEFLKTYHPVCLSIDDKRVAIDCSGLPAASFKIVQSYVSRLKLAH